VDPPEKGGPDESGPAGQDDQVADQEHPKSDATRKGGRHRRGKHRRRVSAQQVSDLVKCAPGIFRIVDEVGKHETPIREWIHTLTGVAQQVLDVISGWLT
jgi:hypothetical protein